MGARSTFDSAILYDPLNHGADVLRHAPFVSWLGGDASRWRASRNAPDINNIPGPLCVRFVGEQGAGKTTQLVEALAGAQPNFVKLKLDFNHASDLALATDPREVAQQVANHVRNSLESCIHQVGIAEQHEAAKTREIILNRGHYTLTEVKQRYRHRLGELSDQTLLNSTEISRATSTYVSQLGAVPECTLTLRALQSIPGRRLLVAVDNMDHLGSEKILAIFNFLSTALVEETVLFIALRSEHEQLAYRPFSARPHKTIRLDNDGAIFSIITLRLESARSYMESLPNVDHSDLGVQLSILESALSALKNDVVSARLFEDWHNGNIRQMLTFFVSNANRLSPTKGRPGATRGLLYESLIRDSKTDLLSIFSPQHVSCAGGRFKFVFIRLRLLAYLKNMGDSCDLSMLYKDFESSFEVPRKRLDQAIDDLCSEDGDGGALVRQGSAHLPVSQLGIADTLVLLPAGRRFISEVVYSCHFLSWIYDNRSQMPDISAAGLKDSEILLEKACIAVDRVLLKAFRVEHPYIEGDHAITPEERVRLDAYCDMFDYGVGRWFVKSLIDELNQYAVDRGISTPHLGRVRGRVKGMVQRLDGIVGSQS